MQDRIEYTLQSLFEHLNSIDTVDDSILGTLGSVIFLTDYCSYKDIPIDRYLSSFESKINNYEVNHYKFQSYSEGYLSYGLAYRHLLRKGYYIRNYYLEESLKKLAITFGYKLLKEHNLDFLFGATGIAHYLLSDTIDDDVFAFLKDYIDYLTQNAIIIKNGLGWEDYNIRTSKNLVRINLGLAHGVPAILKVLITVLKNLPDCNSDKNKVLIEKILSLLINSRVEKKEFVSKHPNLLGDNADQDFSRLGWCYGDLGIGYILYQTGLAIQDSTTEKYAKTLLEETLKRKTIAETNVIDAGICHGSAGVMHMYNRMFLHTNLPVFREGADFWLRQTLNLMDQNGKIHFLKYNGFKKSYEKDLTFLEGGAGIGSVLLSYLTKDYDWDSIILLNSI